ncbi:hypothetical protein DFP72DRAFT_1018347 [Ephemerocybe angulata]|uniref:F-box domain-containing protein n=1 Tax=Ephemerocybe angulata TaxID=980116 RepID=A0A8H6HFI7_9AGAR|nr:hypothetical protein DFP72DRAFT_1018347 [Tulosesus angulatus]
MDLPFQQHFNTNYVPEDYEVQDIKTLIRHRQVIVDRIDEEIRALTERRNAHADIIHKYSELVSPIRRLPAGILSTLFLASKARQEGSLTFAPSDMPAVVVFSHVCRQWRAIVLGMPLLWTSIHVLIPATDPLVTAWQARVELQLDKLNCWLSRSAACPLTVYLKASDTHNLVYGDNPELSNDQASARFMDILCSSSPRWKEVHFTIAINSPSFTFIRPLLCTSDEVPQLEKVHLDVLVAFEEPEITGNTFSILGAPSITSLKLTRLWDSPPSLPAQWSSLTTLSIGSGSNSIAGYGSPPSVRCNGNQVLKILQLCPNLVRFSVDAGIRADNWGFGVHEESPGEGKVSHLVLESLSIQGHSIPAWVT